VSGNLSTGSGRIAKWRRSARAWRANPMAALGDITITAFTLWLAADLPGDIIHGRIVYIALDVALVIFYGWILRARVTGRRPSVRRERKALLAAARKMAHDEVWLNRDEHIAIACSRRRIGTQVMVIPEDDMREIYADGAGTFVTTTYIIIRGGTEVMRMVDGARVAMRPDGELDIAKPERKSEWRKWRDAGKMAADMRRGYLAPDRHELEQVAQWLAGAERIGSLDEMPGEDES
jgi:hypothetical protein